MTLRHLKIFVSVCDCGSVTAAANSLSVAQPSVSLAISELEKYYGIKLFDRITRKLQLTESGHKFLEYASHIVSLFGEMESGIKNWDFEGKLRVGSSITIGTYFMPMLVKEFNSKYPEIKVFVTIDNSLEIEKKVITNELDFALIEGKIHNENIIKEKFMQDKMVFICGNELIPEDKETIKLSELPLFDFVLREKGSAARDIFDSVMLVNNIEINPVWECVSTQAIIKAVAAGHGASVLSYKLVEEDIKRSNIRKAEIENISFNRHYYIIYHKNKFLSQASLNFMSICKKLNENDNADTKEPHQK